MPGSGSSLLSWKTSQDLNLLALVNQIKSTTALVEEYKALFSGLGKLKDYQVKLHIDESVSPVAMTHRRVPFHLRKQLEEQIKADEELGVLEKQPALLRGYHPSSVCLRRQARSASVWTCAAQIRPSRGSVTAHDYQ